MKYNISIYYLLFACGSTTFAMQNPDRDKVGFFSENVIGKILQASDSDAHFPSNTFSCLDTQNQRPIPMLDYSENFLLPLEQLQLTENLKPISPNTSPIKATLASRKENISPEDLASTALPKESALKEPNWLFTEMPQGQRQKRVKQISHLQSNEISSQDPVLVPYTTLSRRIKANATTSAITVFDMKEKNKKKKRKQNTERATTEIEMLTQVNALLETFDSSQFGNPKPGITIVEEENTQSPIISAQSSTTTSIEPFAQDAGSTLRPKLKELIHITKKFRKARPQNDSILQFKFAEFGTTGAKKKRSRTTHKN